MGTVTKKRKSPVKKKQSTKKSVVKKTVVKKKVIAKKKPKKVLKGVLKKEDSFVFESDILKELRKLSRKHKPEGYITRQDIKETFPDLYSATVLKIERWFKSQGFDVLKGDLLFSNDDVQKKKRYKTKTYQDSTGVYLNEIGRYDLLSRKEEQVLGKHSNNNNEKIRDQMVLANLRLVVNVAKKYMKKNSNMSLMDLVQEGTFGLFRAIEGYDPSKGFAFSTYATWWIRQAITRAKADKSRTVRIPVHMLETITAYINTHRYLQNKLGREPLVVEIANEMGKTIEQVTAIRKSQMEVRSMDSFGGGQRAQGDKDGMGVNTSSINIDSDSINRMEEEIDQNILKQRVEMLFSPLTEKEREILKMRYGMNSDGSRYTLEQIGKVMKITRERVRQIESRALEKIKDNDDLDMFQDSVV